MKGSFKYHQKDQAWYQMEIKIFISPFLKAICSICLQEPILKRKRNAFLRFNLPGLTEPFMQVIQAFNFIPIDYIPSFPCNSVNFNMVIGFR